MSYMKEISVIVPIYNVEKYLEKCLQSLKNQKFDSYEVILVDDGANDNSRAIAEKFVKFDGELFMLITQENKGLSEARNTGMKYAKGKYICFVDSDDYVEASYLRELYQCAQKEDVDLVFCAFQSVDEDGNILHRVYEKGFNAREVYNVIDRKELLLTQNAAWNKLYKKEIIDKYQLTFTPDAWYEDLRFVKKYMTFASKFAYCDVILYNYLVRQGSIMNSIGSKRNVEILDAIDEVIQFYRERNLYETYCEEIEFLAIDHIYISSLVRLIRAKDKEQFKYIKKQFMDRFPKYKKNKYVSGLEKNRKLIFRLMNMKTYGLIRLLFNIKEKRHD